MSLLGEKTVDERIRDLYDIADAARDNILEEQKGISLLERSLVTQSYSTLETKIVALANNMTKLSERIRDLLREKDESKWLTQFVLNFIGHQIAKQRECLADFTDEERMTAYGQISDCSLTSNQLKELLEKIVEYSKENQSKS